MRKVIGIGGIVQLAMLVVMVVTEGHGRSWKDKVCYGRS